MFLRVPFGTPPILFSIDRFYQRFRRMQPGRAYVIGLFEEVLPLIGRGLPPLPSRAGVPDLAYEDGMVSGLVIGGYPAIKPRYAAHEHRRACCLYLVLDPLELVGPPAGLEPELLAELHVLGAQDAHGEDAGFLYHVVGEPGGADGHGNERRNEGGPRGPRGGEGGLVSPCGPFL